MSSSPDKITLAFFGATGGCANACLAHTLKGGYRVVALARTPSKLTTQLQEQGLDEATISKNLTIVQGDATDIEAVKRTIAPEQNNGALVSSIISGMGGTPKLQASIAHPVSLTNPQICEQATNTLITAIKELHQPQPMQQLPLLTIISTTGISDAKGDVPLTVMPLYRYFLSVPHEDKLKMENAVFANVEGAIPTPAFRGAISVRPSTLTGDHKITSGKGWQSLRTGTEVAPAVGYTITRADVGEWIYEQIVRTGGQKWVGEKVTLTN